MQMSYVLKKNIIVQFLVLSFMFTLNLYIISASQDNFVRAISSDKLYDNRASGTDTVISFYYTEYQSKHTQKECTLVLLWWIFF